MFFVVKGTQQDAKDSTKFLFGHKQDGECYPALSNMSTIHVCLDAVSDVTAHFLDQLVNFDTGALETTAYATAPVVNPTNLNNYPISYPTKTPRVLAALEGLLKILECWCLMRHDDRLLRLYFKTTCMKCQSSLYFGALGLRDMESQRHYCCGSDAQVERMDV